MLDNRESYIEDHLLDFYLILLQPPGEQKVFVPSSSFFDIFRIVVFSFLLFVVAAARALVLLETSLMVEPWRDARCIGRIRGVRTFGDVDVLLELSFV